MSFRLFVWVLAAMAVLVTIGSYSAIQEAAVNFAAKSAAAKSAAKSQSLRIEAEKEAAKETERLRQIIEAEHRKIDDGLETIREFVETNPAKAQEIFDRARQIKAERDAPKRTVQTAAEKEAERLEVEELQAHFERMQPQIDDRIKKVEQYVEAVGNKARQAKKEAEDTAKESQQRTTDLMRRASQIRINRDRALGKGELIDNQFYRPGE